MNNTLTRRRFFRPALASIAGVVAFPSFLKAAQRVRVESLGKVMPLRIKVEEYKSKLTEYGQSFAATYHVATVFTAVNHTVADAIAIEINRLNYEKRKSDKHSGFYLFLSACAKRSGRDISISAIWTSVERGGEAIKYAYDLLPTALANVAEALSVIPRG